MNVTARLVTTLCFGALSNVLAAEPVEAPLPWPGETSLRFVDESGSPLGVIYGRQIAWNRDGNGRWEGGAYSHRDAVRDGRRIETYVDVNFPDADGRSILRTGGLTVELFRRLPIVATTPDGKRMAAVRLTRREAIDAVREGRDVTITLRPATEVRGRVSIPGLRPEESRRDLTLSLSDVAERGAGVPPARSQILYFGEPSNAVSISLPEGNFSCHASGEHLGDDRRAAGVLIEVPADAETLTLPRIELLPRRYLTLIGEPAPELDDVTAWINSDPVKLADHRGKVVLLHFWNSSYKRCIEVMPTLIDLDESFGDDLAVVSVHATSPHSIPPDAKWFATYFERTGEQQWAGRRVTFPVAVSRDLRFGDHPENVHDVQGRPVKVAGPTREYDVQKLPTTLLIGRDGTVLGPVDLADPAAVTVAVRAALLNPLVRPARDVGEPTPR